MIVVLIAASRRQDGPASASEVDGLVTVPPGPELEQDLAALALRQADPVESWLVVSSYGAAGRSAAAVRVLRRTRPGVWIDLAAVRCSPLRLHVVAEALAACLRTGRVPDVLAPVVLQDLVAATFSVVLSRSVLTVASCGATWSQRLTVPRSDYLFVGTDGPGRPRRQRVGTGGEALERVVAGGAIAGRAAIVSPGASLDVAPFCRVLGITDVTTAPGHLDWADYWRQRGLVELVVRPQEVAALVDRAVESAATWPCAWCSAPLVDAARCHRCSAAFEHVGAHAVSDVVVL